MKNKEIDEMARTIAITEQIARDAVGALPSPKMYATDLYEKGYRKQKEGHWITRAASYECSECGEEVDVDNPEDYDPVSDYDLRFCPHCGAKMKGAEYGKTD